MFDIDAKSDPSIDAELQALPSDQAKRRKQLMVQALLADRCKLAAHQETRELPVYALVVAKGGPKFKPSETNGTTINTGRSRLHIAGSDDTITPENDSNEILTPYMNVEPSSSDCGRKKSAIARNDAILRHCRLIGFHIR